ncbi:MAG: response regulator transcription factor [Elusimicrobiales bacterium]|nr:response regulator transcription factor [Elusimicrobiales bacterium]
MTASKNILVVDDDAKLGEGLCEVLELEGFVCARAATAQEAVRLAAQLKPSVVLTDLQLPDSNGFQLCQSVKKISRDTVIIMMTGRFLSTEEKTQGLQLGADDYITKPFDLRELSARIRSILARSARPAGG